MAPHQQGQAGEGRCYCPNPQCARSNFTYNSYCHICGWSMPKKLILQKPNAAPAKGAGKGKSKGKGNNGNGKGNDGGRAADKSLCSCCGVKGHAKADCRQRDKTCSSCGKTGHLAKVCRSSSALPQAPALKDEAFTAAFAAECARRGMPVAEAPALPDAQPSTEHSATSITAKSKAKDEASKKLNKLIDRKLDAEKALKKLVDEVGTAADVLHQAELDFQNEVAATHLAMAPKTDFFAFNMSAFL